jgi:arsenate reductase-like glutaredoxin family protein
MNGIDVQRRDYFRDRFDEDELADLIAKLGITPAELLSKRSRAYQSRKEALDAMSGTELIREMVAEPTLIRRPIVISDARQLVGSRKADREADVLTQKKEG